MKIEDALKKTFDIRISCYDKWLVWDQMDECYIIYQRKLGMRKTRRLFMTPHFEMALTELMKED